MTPLAKKVFELFGKPELAAEVEGKQPDKRTSASLAAKQELLPNYRKLYQQMAEAIAGDGWAIDPAWLLNQPEQWEKIKALDDRLTLMECAGASEPEYQAVLERLVQCVCDTLAAYERDRGTVPVRAYAITPAKSPADNL
jgi:hypothetical protein